MVRRRKRFTRTMQKPTFLLQQLACACLFFLPAMPCSNCGGAGHNRATCPERPGAEANPQDDALISGRLRSRGDVIDTSAGDVMSATGDVPSKKQKADSGASSSSPAKQCPEDWLCPVCFLGWTGVSRISFRNLICCPFIRFAKFRAKLDMLSIFPQPKFQIWHTWGLRALCTGPRPKQKMRFRPPETPFSSETDGFHQIDDTHDESIYGNFIFGSRNSY